MQSFIIVFIIVSIKLLSTSANNALNKKVTISSNSLDSIIFYSSEETCTTPYQQRLGNCIRIEDCPSLMQVLRRVAAGPRDEADLEFLRQSQCGFVDRSPKVCCPQQQQQPEIIKNVSQSSSEPPNVSRHENLRLLEHQSCGHIIQPKIFGGNKTGVFDYPWMALLAYRIRNRIDFRCGGSIINKRYIITAAHCVTQLPSHLVLIGARVGEHDLRTERDCDRDENGLEDGCAERYQDFGIEKINYHPDYSKISLKNDIALVRLDANIDFRPRNVKPICLPIDEAAARISQKKLTVTGWGATELGPRSQDLLKVNVPPVNNEECAESYIGKAEIWEKQLCAGGTRGMDSCNGDSGGPLQSPSIYKNNPRFVLHGIVSFGPKACGTGLPGVYTRVVYYADWILNTIRE